MISNIFKKKFSLMNIKFLSSATFVLLLTFSVNVSAEETAAAVSPEVAYILNTFLFLVCGFLVMFMAAGFCMLEAGQVRSKNTAVICLKNIDVSLLYRFKQV